MVLLIAGALGFNALNSDSAQALSAADKEEIRAYLIANPEILEEMIAALETKRQLATRAKAQETIVEKQDQLFHGDPAFFAGNPDGKIALVEFFDYNCGYCRRAAPDLLALIDENPDLKVVFKEYPVLGPESLVAARAGVAAAKQDRYADFHFALMAHNGPINEDAIFTVAETLGMDTNRLQLDMASEDVDRVLEANFALGQSLGVTGTPNFIIGDTMLPGAVGIQVMSRVIEDVRENGCAVC